MKKAIHLLIISALVIMLSLPLLAHDAVTTAEWGTPDKIDGIKDSAWDNAQSIEIADEAITDAGDQTATAKVYTLWDGEYLYCFAEITDPTVDAELKDDAWDQDAIGFMVNYDYSKRTEEGVSYRDLGDAAYAGYVNVPAVEGSSNYPEAPTIFGIAKYADAVESYCVITDKGYNVEIRLPLALYKDFAAGDKIGFEICLNNSTGGGARASQTVWKFKDNARGSDSWQYAANFGTLILGEQVIEEVADEPVADVEVSPASGDRVAALMLCGLSIAGIAVAKKRAK